MCAKRLLLKQDIAKKGEELVIKKKQKKGFGSMWQKATMMFGLLE